MRDNVWRIALAAVLFTLTALPSLAQASKIFGLYVYPAKGQSEEQQASDESICYKWAKAQTSVDPAALPPATPAPTQKSQNGAVKGAARGAAAGAVFGAIWGNAGAGAASGALAGGISGHRNEQAVNNAAEHYAQASANEQRSQQVGDFKRAFSACLESKSYTVK